jgi:hypothetical protein
VWAPPTPTYVLGRWIVASGIDSSSQPSRIMETVISIFENLKSSHATVISGQSGNILFKRSRSLSQLCYLFEPRKDRCLRFRAQGPIPLLRVSFFSVRSQVRALSYTAPNIGVQLRSEST